MNKQHLTGGIITAIAAGLTLGAVGATPAAAQTQVAIKSGRSTTTIKTRTAAPKVTKIVIHRHSPRPASRVTMNLRNAPVRTALTQLFQKAHRDYSLDNNVSGVVNMKITNKPFDEALRLITQNSTMPLTYMRDSGVYFIRPAMTQAMRNSNTVVAQNEPSQNEAVEASQVPNNPAQLEEATTITAPPVNYLGNVNPATINGFGFGAFPGLGFQPVGYPINGFGFQPVGLPVNSGFYSAPVIPQTSYFVPTPTYFQTSGSTVVAPGMTLVNP